MSKGLGDTRALVVGASVGIGRAIATELVAEGAAVAFSARRADVLAEAVVASGGGGRAVAVAGDISDPAACERIVADALDALGALDLVVFSVGVAPLRRLLETSADDWRRVRCSRSAFSSRPRHCSRSPSRMLPRCRSGRCWRTRSSPHRWTCAPVGSPS